MSEKFDLFFYFITILKENITKNYKMSAIEKILDVYIVLLCKREVIDIKAIKEVQEEYLNSINVKERKTPAQVDDGDYVETTLDDSLKSMKKPIKILVKEHKDGTLECTQIPGLLVKKCEDGKVRAYGTRIDDVVREELPMKYLILCRANGYRFVAENAVGSGKYVKTELTD